MDQNSVIMFSSNEAELLIVGDRLWMTLMSRRLEDRMNSDRPQATADENGKRNAANLSGYVCGAGPIPKYREDLAAAQHHHDDWARWFWSTYSVALAELNVEQPFTHDARRVISRLRFKALAPVAECGAA